MRQAYELTDAGDSARKIYVVDGTKERIVTVFDNEEIMRQLAEDRREDGFDRTRTVRRVARINMETVKLLAIRNKDSDAHMYLWSEDEDERAKARDRMIERYPELFKACSGGI